MMDPRCPLDPQPGPPIRFTRTGKHRWSLGNRPTRLALEIAENDNGEVVLTERDPVTGDVVEDEAA